jgi:hypothetical protein
MPPVRCEIRGGVKTNHRPTGCIQRQGGVWRYDIDPRDLQIEACCCCECRFPQRVVELGGINGACSPSRLASSQGRLSARANDFPSHDQKLVSIPWNMALDDNMALISTRLLVGFDECFGVPESA